LKIVLKGRTMLDDGVKKFIPYLLYYWYWAGFLTKYVPPFCNLFQPSLNSSRPGTDVSPRHTKILLYSNFKFSAQFWVFLVVYKYFNFTDSKDSSLQILNRHGMYVTIFVFNSRLESDTSNICLIRYPKRPIINHPYSETLYIFQRKGHKVNEFTNAQWYFEL
jgi:hypothetical protein